MLRPELYITVLAYTSNLDPEVPQVSLFIFFNLRIIFINYFLTVVYKVDVEAYTVVANALYSWSKCWA